MAYIDEVEEPNKEKSEKVNQKVYYSALVKAAPAMSNADNPSDPVHLDQVIPCDIVLLHLI